MPHAPSGNGSITRQCLPCRPEDIDEGLAVERQRHRLADLRVAERCHVTIDDQIGGNVLGTTSQMAFGACEVTSLIKGMVTSAGKVMSNSPATKARIRVERFSIPATRCRRGRVCPFSSNQGCVPARRVAALKLDKRERSRADRMAAHVLARDMAGISRHIA